MEDPATPRWKFVTGSPLVRSKRADPDMEYFIDFGENGQLYEYSKAFGRRVRSHVLLSKYFSDCCRQLSSFIHFLFNVLGT